VDAGFILSDHADWDGLIRACKGTEAECVYTTHGFQSVFTRYLNEQGIASKEVKTEYGDDESEQTTLDTVEKRRREYHRVIQHNKLSCALSHNL
jgi:hypothetical protein